MNLKVLNPQANSPWYTAGLRFDCNQCGNCCTGGPGYVWISDVEVGRLAEHLKLSREQVIEQYARRIGKQISLKEQRNSRGEYDCIFLQEIKATRKKGDETIVYNKRVCTIYPVRPLQCRTWPFWEGNLASPDAWRRSAERCPGMNSGARVFDRGQIEALRDAKDWPTKPPTSEQRSTKPRASAKQKPRRKP